MKRRPFLFGGLLAAALAAAFVVARLLPTSGQAGAPPAAPGPDRNAALPVFTHTVKVQPLTERITATGTLRADESVDLVSELSGKVVAIEFEEGTRVQRGAVLLKIDDSELRAQLARAQSRVSLARAQAERQKQLGVGVGTTQEALDAALSEVRVLEAEAEVVASQLAKTVLRAPFDGLIGLRYVSEGAFLTPATRIATLQKIDPIKVEFAVAERHLDRIQRDGKVQISVAGVDGPIAGEIYAIEPRVDMDTRMLRLRARAPNSAGRVLPGGFATVELPLREIPDAIMVPADALVPGLNQQQVYVIEQGRAQPRTVATGIRSTREVQILSGLQSGEVVITSGQLQLRPGMPVQAVPREESAAAPGARSS